MEQIFTSYDNPKGNADTERVMRTIKEDIIWLNEFNSFEEARERIGKWIAEGYNRLYVHSQPGYLTRLSEIQFSNTEIVNKNSRLQECRCVT